MDDQQRAEELLAESEIHFRLVVQHRRLANENYNKYKAIMKAVWDGSFAGEGDGG